MIRTLQMLFVTLGLALASACGGDACPPPAQACPAPPPQAGPIDIGGLLDGISSGDGDAALTIPGYGETEVSLDCSSVTVNKNTPEAGKTEVKLTCTFSKLAVISGDLNITIVIDAAGKGTITATGTAKVPFVGDKPINVTIDLTGGSQTGQTISVNVTVNGTCGKGTIRRDGDKLIIEVDDPKTKIELEK